MKTIRAVSLLAVTCVSSTVLVPSRLAAQAVAPDGRDPVSAKPPPKRSRPIEPLTNASEEVIVTAQKRQEKIQNVGMSIQAISGDTLNRLGVTDTTQLAKITPGFTYSFGFDGAPVYSIRGVGFQDTTLAASPAVSVYNDEIPLPFSSLTLGSTLDLRRVEILKGPQGTLFGENATGGAINYVANKPTDHLEAGVDASYGSFNTGDIQGYVSGPVSDTLDLRLALRTIQGDGWQQSYTRDASHGVQNFSTGRFSALWTPSEDLRILATVGGFYDHSDTQAPQFYGISPLEKTPLIPGLLNYPVAPKNDQAADWGSCVNTTPLLTGCTGYSKSNKFYSGSVRIDYTLPNTMTLTSLTAYEKYQQYYPFDGDGTSYKDYEALATGHLDTVYQELRLHGQFAGRGDWIIGGNYEYDGSYQNIFTSFPDSSTGVVLGVPIVGAVNVGGQYTDTYAAFAHAEYPVADSVTLNGGVRFTQADKSLRNASNTDNGNGRLAYITTYIQNLLQTGNPLAGTGINVGPGGQTTLGAGPNFLPGKVDATLDENNVSWRVGADWKALPNTLIYGNISKGYKSGSFPIISATESDQFNPAKQESLLAFEAGFKTSLIDQTLQLNGAGFYYHYYDKQIQGDVADPIFGALPKLVNVPHSHIAGFEVSALWTPLPNFTISPGLSFAQTRIDGNFSTFNYLGLLQNVTGERFPNTPEWQASIDAQYNYRLNDAYTVFLGGNLSYQGAQNSSFGDFAVLNNQAFVLLDLRAGVDTKKWRVQLWGRNVTNQFYTNYSVHVVDAYTRYTGMPATVGVELSYKFY